MTRELWMSTGDACDELGITLRTLYRIIDEGRLPCYQFGRVYRLRTEDVEQCRSGNDPDAGEAGVREPRRPRPTPSPGAATLEPPGPQSALHDLPGGPR